MTQRYIFVRMRKEDFEKIIREKKIPMEQDLKAMAGKEIKIKNTQLMKIAANATWDLGADFQHKIINAVKLKKGALKGL